MVTDLLAYIAERRKAIQRERSALDRELIDLDAAERVERARVARSGGAAQLVFGVTPDKPQPPRPAREAALTIKQMIGLTIYDAGPDGLASPSIADQIRQRWLPDYRRENVSPKLTAMKDDGLVYPEGGVWKLTDKGRAGLEKFRGQAKGSAPSTDPAVGAG